MILKVRKYTYLLLVFLIFSCAKTIQKTKDSTKKQETKVEEVTEKPKKTPEKVVKNIITAADQTKLYLPLLKGKNVAVVGNQTSIVSSELKVESLKFKDEDLAFTHLVDTLLASGVRIKKVFSPEHGFRGKADAGEHVKNGIDTKTGLQLVSLYGNNKKPTKNQLKEIDIVVFDLQDVGVRFYTYISTLHYVMEACAENNIPLIVLDRPNPNGHYIDGTVLKKKYKSFIGMHPVPIVYGMTIGEYAKMINGEKWLNNGIQCDLQVIPLQHYNHKMTYDLPVKPSPNLPNAKSVNLYPSLCFFEGTMISCGRGTDKQFQIYGSPYLHKTDFTFTPQPNDGSKHPKHQNRLCYGKDLRATPRLSKIDLSWLIKAHEQTSQVKTKFWKQNNLFTKLAGNTLLKQQIKQGLSEEEIRKTWEKDLIDFMKIRVKYLIYK